MLMLNLSSSKVPIWINIWHLPFEFWNLVCLGHVASGVGRLLYVNSFTENHQRLSLARILVEVDTNIDFPKNIEVDKGNGRSCLVGIEYPWIHSKCDQCKIYGHLNTACLNSLEVIKSPSIIAKFGVRCLARKCASHICIIITSQVAIGAL